MIDKKRLTQRLNKGSKLKQLPILNFAILVFTIIQVLGEFFKNYYLQLLKPIPIILMIIYVHDKNKLRQHLVPRITQIGLILCLVGDLFLMSNQLSSFVIGTIFFMIGHIFYIIAFRIGQHIRTLNRMNRWIRKGVYLIIIAATVVNVVMFWNKYPVKSIFILYTIVLAVQALMIVSRYEITGNSSYYFAIIGGIAFAFSDNLLGFLKFNALKSDLGRAIVMVTYYIAQYFIMHGSLHQSNLQYELDKYQDRVKRTY